MTWTPVAALTIEHVRYSTLTLQVICVCLIVPVLHPVAPGCAVFISLVKLLLSLSYVDLSFCKGKKSFDKNLLNGQNLTELEYRVRIFLKCAEENINAEIKRMSLVCCSILEQ